jgi:hypothetical protein
MRINFETLSTLQYLNRSLSQQVEDFKSGEKYKKMDAEYKKLLCLHNREVKRLEFELSKAHSETVTVRRYWSEVMDDLDKENQKTVRRLLGTIERLKKENLELISQRDDTKDKLHKRNQDFYAVSSELEKERGKNQKLMAQLNRDYENSSIPSSKTIRNKKITNSREKTGRKPGGQPGHKGHCQKKQTPTTEPVLLPPPQEVMEDSDFKKTSKTIKKQLINVRVMLEVTEYHADVYYNSKTGERIHAAFPEGVVDDVNYGGSIKAFLFLLNNECCTSIDKSRKFLSDLTDGKLNISKGMINKLSREFAQKSEEQRKELFSDMLLCPVMHTDCTNAKVNGKNAYVFVCVTPDGKTLYFAREKKGHEGVKGTVTEDYQGILVHDHEKTFYSYGSNHQECLAHILRYLKDSIDNESDRTWNQKMRSLVQEMIHYRKSIPPEAEPDPVAVSKFEERYREILQTAKEEYEYIPPGDYYRDGYNLYLRMKEYMSNHLLFLHDYRVPATNNEAERLLRSYKRKQQQAVSFRSFENIDYLCQCMSMLVMMRQNEEENIFHRVSEIFN